MLWNEFKFATGIRLSGRADGGAGSCRSESDSSIEPEALTGPDVRSRVHQTSVYCLHTCWNGRSTWSIFDRRETVMGPRNSRLETLRRTQTVGDYPKDYPKRTVSDAYPWMTSMCPTPCMHAPQLLRVEFEQQISTHEETLGKVRNATQRINASTI